MRILSSGNVGIGTTSPDEILHVAKSSGDAIVAVEANDGNAALYLTSAGTNKDNRIVIGNAKDLKFEAQASGSGQGQGQDPTATGTTVMTLSNDGNLGLGGAPASISSTAHWLTLNADSGSSASGGIIHQIDGTTKGALYVFGSHIYNDAKSGIGHIFAVNNGTEAMRIDTSGNVFIGRTSAGNTGNGHSIRGGDSAIFSRDASGETMQVCRNDSTGDLIRFLRNGTVCGEIVNTGATTVAYNTSSDYRLKENVVEMTGALDRIDQLKPSRFNFIADGDITVDGFLAHEVADVVPEAITGEKDAIDDEGNPIYQSIDQSKLVPLLVGAIKELKAEIQQLKNK